MAEAQSWESPLAWNEERPDTLVICCSDGRWRRHIEQFVSDCLGGEQHADILAVPGGVEPLTLFDLLPKDFSFLRRRVEGLVGAHGTTRIVTIAHQDCAWYKLHTIGPIRFDLRQRQLSDLKRAAARLRQMFPEVAVETWFARLEPGPQPRIVFEVA